MMLYIMLLMCILTGQTRSSEKPVLKIPLARKYFQDAELVWSETFEGKMTDFAIAEKSGHVVIGAVKDLKGCVYLFSPDGKLLWTKENGKDSKIKKCAGVAVAVSDKGETIGVVWGGDYEREEVQVYDHTGKKLYARKHGMSGAGVEVSPGGGYIRHAWFFDKMGNQMKFSDIMKGTSGEKLQITAFEFVSESEVLVRYKNALCLYSFPEGKLKWKSQGLELKYSGKITPKGRYILLSGEQNVYLFAKNGKLIWERRLDWNLYSHDVAFSSNNKYIIILSGSKILILDSRTGEIKLKRNEKEQQSFSLQGFLCLGNKIFISGYTGSYVKDVYKGFWTNILEFDKDCHIIDASWERGLVGGDWDSPLIGVYESDATGETKNEGVLGFENSTIFTINILKRKD